jgi:hypothetical protein
MSPTPWSRRQFVQGHQFLASRDHVLELFPVLGAQPNLDLVAGG